MPPRNRPARFRVRPKTARPKVVAKVRRTKVQAYTVDWDAISKAIIKRDCGRCTECPATKDLNVHHIIPVSRGGRTVGYNLKTLCRRCHSSKHSHMH